MGKKGKTGIYGKTEERALREQLRCMEAALIPEEVKRRETLREIHGVIQEKRVYRVNSFRELLIIELQYLSPAFWIVQGILVGILAVALEKTSLDQGSLADYLRWVSVLAAWMGVLGCSSLARHFSRGMAELEQSCYFNLPQLWTIRITLSGAVDIVALVLSSGRIAGKTEQPFGQVCLYVLVPFVLSNVCCLLLFTALRGGRERYRQFAAALVLGGLAAVPGMTPGEFYEAACLWAWAAVLFAGIGLYLWELKYMFGKIKRGEMVCWN